MSKRTLFYAFSLTAFAALSTRCGSSNSNTPWPEGDGGIGTGGDSGGSSSGGASSSGSQGSSGTASSSGGGEGSGSGSGGGSGGSSGSGSGGSSGSGSGGGSGSGSGSVGGSGPSVLQRGNDIYRRATFTAPGLAESAVTTMAPDTTFNTNATFPANGNTQNQGTASVLYLEDGPAAAGCPAGATGCTATARAANAGLFFAFPALGSNPNVVAFDETTGLTVWTAHVTRWAEEATESAARRSSTR